ncbi:MAG: quinone oxidoreductase [Devosiaceae bacterium]|nr:quinone oxidoreductase [Devosiaceae bacterium MH13]
MPIPTERIVIRQTGGPEELRLEEALLPDPGPGEVNVEHTAIGLNFIDVYFRTGLYPAPSGVPFTPGHEGAGVIVAMGGEVTDLSLGDRVAYLGPLGSYARHRAINADRVIKLPDAINDETAAAMMLKGMTARYLLRKSYVVDASTVLLFHAAAGGVGLIAGQWAKHLGATAIGTAGTDEKCALARAHGYTHAINYETQSFVEEVERLTGGEKCHVVYDSIGQATFPASLDCLRTFGTFVSFGNASGPIKDFDLAMLGPKGSLYATRPTVFVHTGTRALLEETANDLIDVVTSGAVKIPVAQRFSLADAAQAHRALESRSTTGATVLLPNG